MKKILILFFIVFSTVAFGQGMKIKWEDQDGREFTISAPSGNFSYGMIVGDKISYNYSGNISKIGPVVITYNYNGLVSKVGSVIITYNYDDNVVKVGGLTIRYDYDGRIKETFGSVL